MINKIKFSIVAIAITLIFSSNFRVTTVPEKIMPIISIETLSTAIAQTEWCENGIKDQDENYYFDWLCLCTRCECVTDTQDCCLC